MSDDKDKRVAATHSLGPAPFSLYWYTVELSRSGKAVVIGKAYATLMAIASYVSTDTEADGYGAAWATERTLAEHVGVSVPTIRANITRLVRCAAITCGPCTWKEGHRHAYRICPIAGIHDRTTSSAAGAGVTGDMGTKHKDGLLFDANATSVTAQSKRKKSRSQSERNGGSKGKKMRGQSVTTGFPNVVSNVVNDGINESRAARSAETHAPDVSALTRGACSHHQSVDACGQDEREEEQPMDVDGRDVASNGRNSNGHSNGHDTQPALTLLNSEELCAVDVGEQDTEWHSSATVRDVEELTTLFVRTVLCRDPDTVGDDVCASWRAVVAHLLECALPEWVEAFVEDVAADTWVSAHRDLFLDGSSGSPAWRATMYGFAQWARTHVLWDGDTAPPAWLIEPERSREPEREPEPEPEPEPKAKRKARETEPWVTEVLDELCEALHWKPDNAEHSRRKWVPIIKKLMGGATPEQRRAFVTWMFSDHFLADKGYMLTGMLESQWEAWAASGNPVSKATSRANGTSRSNGNGNRNGNGASARRFTNAADFPSYEEMQREEREAEARGGVIWCFYEDCRRIEGALHADDCPSGRGGLPVGEADRWHIEDGRVVLGR